MKRNKKIISIVLVFFLFSLLAIGSGSSSSSNVKEPSSVTVGTKDLDTANNEKNDASSDSGASVNKKPNETQESSSTNDNSTASKETTISEQVLFDQKNIKITAKKCYYCQNSFSMEGDRKCLYSI